MGRKVFIRNSIFRQGNFNQLREMDKNIDGIAAMCINAIEELLLTVENIKKDVPVFWGSSFSSLKSLHNFNLICEKSGALQVNPSLFPNTVLNSPPCRASIYHHITSPIYNISNGIKSAYSALELAFMYVSNGETDHAIVCSTDEHSELAEIIDNTLGVDQYGAVYLSAQESSIEINLSKELIKKQYPVNELKQNKVLLHIIDDFTKSTVDNEIKLYCNEYEIFIKRSN